MGAYLNALVAEGTREELCDALAGALAERDQATAQVERLRETVRYLGSYVGHRERKHIDDVLAAAAPQKDATETGEKG